MSKASDAEILLCSRELEQAIEQVSIAQDAYRLANEEANKANRVVEKKQSIAIEKRMKLIELLGGRVVESL